MDTKQRVIHNGNVIKFCDATIHVSNKSLWFNFGVYESVKILQGKIFYGDLHAQRLLHSAAIVGIKHEFSVEHIVKWIQKKCETDQVKDGLIRILLLGDAEKNSSADVYFFHLGLTFNKDSEYSKGQKLVSYYGERYLPKAKSISTLINYVALLKAKESNAIDSLLINQKGQITEGTRTNFFIVKDKTIISPKSDDILDGVTRIKLLEIIRRNYNYLERNISLQDVYESNECFITSTSLNVMPIVQIDDIMINNAVVGEITKKLIIDFRAMQKEYLKVE